jgi:UPF0716 protein FxsA
MPAILPFLLLVVPLTEIAIFVLVGSQIGVLATIGLVILTAVTGAILLRIQGFSVLRRVKEAMAENRIPGRDLLHGAMIVLAGVLLLTPGFLTDSLGFLLFVPAVRERLWRLLTRNFVVFSGRQAPERPGSRPRSLDLDESEYSRGSTDGDPSPWRNRPR